MRVTEVCSIAGVGPETLRFYEKRGLLREGVHFTRRPSGVRQYEHATVERLRLVSLAKRAGLTLSELAMWIDAWESDSIPLSARRSFFAEKVSAIEQTITELHEMRAYLSEKIGDLDRGRREE